VSDSASSSRPAGQRVSPPSPLRAFKYASGAGLRLCGAQMVARRAGRDSIAELGPTSCCFNAFVAAVRARLLSIYPDRSLARSLARRCVRGCCSVTVEVCRLSRCARVSTLSSTVRALSRYLARLPVSRFDMTKKSESKKPKPMVATAAGKSKRSSGVCEVTTLSRVRCATAARR